MYLRAMKLPEVTKNDRKYKYDVLHRLLDFLIRTPVMGQIEHDIMYDLGLRIAQDTYHSKSHISNQSPSPEKSENYSPLLKLFTMQNNRGAKGLNDSLKLNEKQQTMEPK